MLNLLGQNWGLITSSMVVRSVMMMMIMLGRHVHVVVFVRSAWLLLLLLLVNFSLGE